MRLAKKRRNAAQRGRRIRRRLARYSDRSRPRLSVFRSLNHVYAQIIDDQRGITLAAASSLDKDFKSNRDDNKCAVAARIGTIIAERARSANVSTVIFDRGPYRYHGRLKALAEAARHGGLVF